jgi:hypothetical protein
MVSCSNYEPDENQSKEFIKLYEISYNEYGYDVKETSDGGYIIAGSVYIPDSGNNVLIIKTDEFGNILKKNKKTWIKNYGGKYNDYARCVQILPQGYLIFGTYTDSILNTNLYLLILNEFGDTIFTRKYGNRSFEYGNYAQVTSAGNYLLVGSTSQKVGSTIEIQNSSNESKNILLLFVNNKGDTIHSNFMLPFGNETRYDEANYVLKDSMGNLLVVGTTSMLYDIGNELDVFVMKFNASEKLTAFNLFGKTGNQSAYSITQNNDGRYLICGSSNPGINGSNDILIIETSKNISDTALFIKTIGTRENETALSVLFSRNKYLILSNTEYLSEDKININIRQFYINYENDSIEVLLDKNIGFTSEYANRMTLTADGGIIITGYSAYERNSDLFLIKTYFNGNLLK